MIGGWVGKHRADRIKHEGHEGTKTNSADWGSCEGKLVNSFLFGRRGRSYLFTDGE